MLGRTNGIEEIAMADNLKHTAAFRLALGRTIPNLQASWVKMGLEGATEALRWGVNDLGGTPVGGPPAGGAARAGAADRPRPRRRPRAGPAQHSLRGPRDLSGAGRQPR